MRVSIMLISVMLFASAFSYSTLFHSHPDTVLKNLREGNWNTYVIYFHSKNKDDQNFKNAVLNNAVSAYGKDVLFADVDVSRQGYDRVLDAIEFDSSRDRRQSGSVTYDQLPFVLEVVHGYGYIVSGPNAHKVSKDHISELLDIGKDQKLEAYH